MTTASINPSTIIAVRDDNGSAGTVTYWGLSGTLDPDRLAASWERAGLDAGKLPELPAPATALNRAVKKIQRGRTLVRPLADGGYAIVNEHAEGETLDYKQTLNVKLDAVSRLVFSDETHALVATIKAAYVLALNELDTTDVSKWLTDLVRFECDGLTLRPEGGVYYVPPFKAAVWSAIKQAVTSVSAHKVHQIPALSGRDALDAVLDSVEREAAEAASKMERELAKSTDGISDRAGKSRLESCDAIEQKVGKYEAMLGTRLDGIREKLGALRENLSTAMLAKAAADEAAAAA